MKGSGVRVTNPACRSRPVALEAAGRAATGDFFVGFMAKSYQDPIDTLEELEILATIRYAPAILQDGRMARGVEDQRTAIDTAGRLGHLPANFGWRLTASLNIEPGIRMKIVDFVEVTKPIQSNIRNAYIDFSQMMLSLVAVVTDVVRDSKRVVGYGFNSNGRYG